VKLRFLIPGIRVFSMILAAFWCSLFSVAVFIDAQGREVNLLGIGIPRFESGGGDGASLFNLFTMFLSLHSILIVLTTVLFLLPCLLLSRYDRFAMHRASAHKWLEVLVFLALGAGVLGSFVAADRTDVGWLLIDLFLAIAAAGAFYQLGGTTVNSRERRTFPGEKDGTT
jgi:hypothetical protein